MKFSLPNLMLVTERSLMSPNLESALDSALEGGARFIQLRETELGDAEVLALAKRIQARCEKFGAQLLINHRVEVARESGAGLHLPERALEKIHVARAKLGKGVLLGASAHSLEAAKRAEISGANYVVFGSVFETASHPQSTPAGLETLRKITSEISIPVYAIGGISIHNARACLNAGARGVAVMRAVWSTPDVAQAVRDLLQVLA